MLLVALSLTAEVSSLSQPQLGPMHGCNFCHPRVPTIVSHKKEEHFMSFPPDAVL